MKTAGATSSWICRRYIIVMKQRLEPVVVHDAAAAADLRRDAVGALLDPARRFGIDRGTVTNPLHDGVQVCQDLRVDAGGSVSAVLIPVLSAEWLSVKGGATPTAASVRCATCPRRVSSARRLAISFSFT